MNALTMPSNWQRVRLGDMTTSFTKQTGFDYSASIKPTLIKEQLPNYIPFIQNKDFLGHYINYKTDYFIPNEIAIRFPQILLNEKCLLISISGAIGNVAVFNHSQNAFIGGAIAVLKFKEKKSLDFVMHFLMSASGQKLLLNSVKSSSHKNLTIADLRDLLIPLPPLNEQIAIANILSALDRYLYSLDALILKKESVKKALSFELLSQRKRLKGFNQAWQRVRLGDICYLKNGFSFKSDLFKNMGIPIIRISNISSVDNCINTNDLVFYDPILIDNDYILKQGDLILAMSGATTGKSCLYNLNKIAYLNQRVGVFRAKTSFCYDFLVQFVFSELFTSRLKLILTAGAQPNISSFDIEDFEILLPPLDEQIAIANILSTLDHEIISLKNKKRQFDNIKKALNHDLMSAKIRVLKK
ncbi:restriction endonuclease subunit S [Helicobacter pylori]|uniref:restriction endonuclease subunit S n=1 Tax=Helicobacter pylori TaxID=210 RepID=UPI001ED9FBCA|nr:restriction endonuclease subunit S [Helicobacter pylori]MCG3068767.1 restriction endonuclease subunit S [Helicobacter pylori]